MKQADRRSFLKIADSALGVGVLYSASALSSSAVLSYANGQLRRIVQNGVSPSGMPTSNDVFRDEEIWQLVLYIRHLPPQGSLVEPSVYGGGESSQVIKTREPGFARLQV